MNEKRIGIIMNGVTGRMGLNQHLVRSILAIRNQGGVVLQGGSRLVPDPILVGRNAAKLEQIARSTGWLAGQQIRAARSPIQKTQCTSTHS